MEEQFMSQLEELKGIKEKLDNGTCTISDLKKYL